MISELFPHRWKESASKFLQDREIAKSFIIEVWSKWEENVSIEYIFWRSKVLLPKLGSLKLKGSGKSRDKKYLVVFGWIMCILHKKNNTFKSHFFITKWCYVIESLYQKWVQYSVLLIYFLEQKVFQYRWLS